MSILFPFLASPRTRIALALICLVFTCATAFAQSGPSTVTKMQPMETINTSAENPKNTSVLAQLPAECGNQKVWFANQCRGQNFFKKLLPKGQKLLSVGGTRSKFIQAIAFVYAHDGKHTVFEYTLDDEGQGAMNLDLSQQTIEDAVKSGAAKITSQGVKYSATPAQIKQSLQGPAVQSQTHTEVKGVGGISATLGDYKIVSRATYSQGYEGSKAYTYDEVLVNLNGRLQLYHSKLVKEVSPGSAEITQCYSESHLLDNSISDVQPGCYTAMAMAQTTSTLTNPACGQLEQTFAWLGGAAANAGCKLPSMAGVTLASGAAGYYAGGLTMALSSGQGELAVLANLAVFGGLFTGGSVVVGELCGVVGALAQDVINNITKCAQGIPLATSELQDIYNAMDDAGLILSELGAAAGISCMPLQGVTETRSGPSEYCGGSEIQCSRHGTKQCYEGASGECQCGEVTWDNQGTFDCACQ